MPTYSGHFVALSGRQVFKDGQPFSPEPSRKLFNHSLEFNWGYGGSGPAQLALALLYDVTGDAQVSLRTYQEFKWAFVSQWRGETWEISSERIQEWVDGWM